MYNSKTEEENKTIEDKMKRERESYQTIWDQSNFKIKCFACKKKGHRNRITKKESK